MPLRLGFVLLLMLGISSPGVSQSSTVRKHWIRFLDKDPSTVTSSGIELSDRAQRRRLRNKAVLFDTNDRPLSQAYLNTLNSLHIRWLRQSRWLNAVSAELSREQKRIVESLPFVKDVRPVASSCWRKSEQLWASLPDTGVVNHGGTLAQSSRINLVAAHREGYTGRGVIIGVMDTGFDLNHVAFQPLNLVGAYDFVDDDSDVGGDQAHHGTQVLSVLAGFENGRYVGSAFEASYLLARTENDDDLGQKEEEDNWIAGLEWLEQQGADIVSSSISFFDDFENLGDNYALADLDGQTALTTLATEIAFQKGVLVFNSAGNMGDRGPGYLGTPSDGKHMIAVGAMYGDSVPAEWSSHGPTWDGRKKPDVIAPGHNITTVSVSSTSNYTLMSGTSFAAPLVAGLAACVLQAHPEWSAVELFNAVRGTASRSKSPDNFMGYGVPDAMKALNYVPSGSSLPVTDLVLYPNPFNDGVQIRFTPKTTGPYSVGLYNILGQYVATLASGGAASLDQPVALSWNGRLQGGRTAPSGVYFLRITLASRSLTRRILKVN